MNWKQQVDKIDKDYKKATVKNAGAAAAGAGMGVAVVTMGPTVAMGIATTFGVASTGTAISTLSGAAATNAALAWLGGGSQAVAVWQQEMLFLLWQVQLDGLSPVFLC